MTRFRYRAVARDGSMVDGRISASSRDQAQERLRARGHVPVSLEQAASFGLRRSGTGFPRRQELAVFTRELAIMLEARVPLDRALQSLANAAEGSATGRVAQQLREEIRKGKSLSEAMGGMDGTFPDYFIGMVEAGEASGALPDVFDRLATMIEKSEALGAKLRGALTYPAFVLGLTVLTLLVLLIFVVPQFASLFGNDREALPLMTRAVLGASDGLRSYGWIAAMALVLIVLGFVLLRNSAAMKARTDAFLLALPGVSKLVATGAAVRFCRSLGTMIQNGVEVTQAVRVARRTLDNAVLQDALEAVDSPLAAGKGLAGPLRETGLLPATAGHILSVGEESGRLPDMLIRTADLLEAELERKIGRFMTLLTPVVMLVLGAVVAVVIGSILSAMLQSYNLAI